MLRRFMEASSIAAVGIPPFPGRLLKFTEGQPLMQGEDVRTWQARMRVRGFHIDVDGFYGRQSKSVATQFQQEKGLEVDGIVGRQTWTAAFSLPIT
jgi:peptidoglycan hydrolase-like protein with peptidoglycan-binding domain